MKRYKVYTKEKGLIKTDEYREIYPLTYHRLDGPAYISYDINGNIANEAYWINGLCYTKENYMKELLKLKVNLL